MVAPMSGTGTTGGEGGEAGRGAGSSGRAGAGPGAGARAEGAAARSPAPDWATGKISTRKRPRRRIEAERRDNNPALVGAAAQATAGIPALKGGTPSLSTTATSRVSPQSASQLQVPASSFSASASLFSLFPLPSCLLLLLVASLGVARRPPPASHRPAPAARHPPRHAWLCLEHPRGDADVTKCLASSASRWASRSSRSRARKTTRSTRGWECCMRRVDTRGAVDAGARRAHGPGQPALASPVGAAADAAAAAAGPADADATAAYAASGWRQHSVAWPARCQVATPLPCALACRMRRPKAATNPAPPATHSGCAWDVQSPAEQY